MEKHVNVVAALHIGVSIFGILFGVVILVVLNLVGGFIADKEASMILHLVGTILSLFLILLSVPGIIAGLGLLRRKEWARILTLILAVINLMNVPLGTAVGVYSLWALVQEETVELFRSPGKKMI